MINFITDDVFIIKVLDYNCCVFLWPAIPGRVVLLEAANLAF